MHVKVRKSRMLPSPIAFPLAFGCIWMISVPMATWEVTGMPKRTAVASMLSLRWANRCLFMANPTAVPMPKLFFEPSMKFVALQHGNVMPFQAAFHICRTSLTLRGSV